MFLFYCLLGEKKLFITVVTKFWPKLGQNPDHLAKNAKNYWRRHLLTFDKARGARSAVAGSTCCYVVTEIIANDAARARIMVLFQILPLSVFVT